MELDILVQISHVLLDVEKFIHSFSEVIAKRYNDKILFYMDFNRFSSCKWVLLFSFKFSDETIVFHKYHQFYRSYTKLKPNQNIY